jgi:hypothetical protein
MKAVELDKKSRRWRSQLAWQTSSCPSEGHDSGAEKVFDEVMRLSRRAGNPQGGGKC